MKTKHRIQMVIGWLALAGLPALAATYVVDNRHAAAADSNPGTPDAPLKTISAAAARTAAGDEVLVRPGVYRECVVLTNSGALGKPIVYRSETPHAAVICGSDGVTGWQAAGPGVWVADVPDLKSNPAPHSHAERGAEWVFVDGAPQLYSEDRNRLMPGSFHFDHAAKKLYLAPEEGAPIQSLKVEMAHRQGLFRPEGSLDDIHVIGFTLLHNAESFRHRPALQLRGRRWLAENNHILWATYSGLQMHETSEAVVRGNLIEWIGDTGIGGVRNRRMLIESNRVFYCNWRLQGEQVSGSKWLGTHDSVVRENHFAYNNGCCIWFDWVNCHNLMVRNLCHDSMTGLFAEGNWDEMFLENICFNNDIGILLGESSACVARRNILFNNFSAARIRFNFNRSGSRRTPADLAAFIERRGGVPDVEPGELQRVAAGYVKYHGAAPGFMSVNNVFWENLFLDNEIGFWEVRDYRNPGPLDVYNTTFSDYNAYRLPTNSVGSSASITRHRGGNEADLTEWQRISGRDAHSVMLAASNDDGIPEWALDRRAEWDIPLRRRAEVSALGFVPSPASYIARGRWMRSTNIEALPLSDPQVKAFRLEYEGRKILMLWTSNVMARRYVRLALEQDEVTVENAYLQQHKVALAGRTIDLVASWLPVYLMDLAGAVRESPAASLGVQPFNPPDQPVDVTVVVPNPAATAQALEALLSVSEGFAVKPERIQASIAAGETARLRARLIPDGSFRRGSGMLRMDATVGTERIHRLAMFSIGEAGGIIPARATEITVDGLLDEWPDVKAGTPPLGMIADADQIMRGDPALRSGAGDLGAKLYAAWTPQALSIAVAVTDDRVCPMPAPSMPWIGDCVEVFVDGRSGDMQWETAPTEGCYQIGVSPAAEGEAPNVVVWSQGAPGRLPGLQTATRPREGGYVVEMRIPLTLRNFPAGDWEPGRPLKLSVMLYDKDDPAALHAKINMGWFSSPGGANLRDTSGWCVLTLGDAATPER